MYTITVTSAAGTTEIGTLRWAVEEASGHGGESVLIQVDDSLKNRELSIVSTLTLPANASLSLTDGTSVQLSNGGCIDLHGTILAENNDAVIVYKGSDTWDRLRIYGSGVLQLTNSDIQLTGYRSNLTLERGAQIQAHQSNLIFSGDMESPLRSGSSIEMVGGSLQVGGAGIYAENGVTCTFQDALLRGNFCNYGDLSLTGCTLEAAISQQSTGSTEATDCTFSSYLELTNSANLRGSGNRFTGAEIFRLNNFQGEVSSLAPFVGAIETENAYIGLTGELKDSVLNGTLAGHDLSYRIEGSLSVRAEQEVRMDSGTELNLNGGHLSVYGTLLLQHDVEGTWLKNTGTGGTVSVGKGGLLSLRNTNADFSNSEATISVQNGGCLQMSNGSVISGNGFFINKGGESVLNNVQIQGSVENAGTMELHEGSISQSLRNTGSLSWSDVTLNGNLTGGGAAELNNCTINGYVETRGSDFTTGSNNVFTNDEVFRLCDFSGNTADLGKLIGSLQTARAYISLGGVMEDAVITADINGHKFDYQAASTLTIAEGKTVQLEEGVLWNLRGLYVQGTLKAHNQQVQDVLISDNDIHILPGGRIELQNSNIRLFPGNNRLYIYEGGRLSMTGGTAYATNCIEVLKNGCLEANGATFNTTVIVQDDTALRGEGNVFSTQEVMQLNLFSGDTGKLLSFIGGTAVEDSYIKLAGRIYSANFADARKYGVEYKLLWDESSVERGETVTFEEGARWVFGRRNHSLVIEGTLIADNRRTADVFLSGEAGNYITVSKTGSVKLRNANVNLGSVRENSFTVEGKMDMEGGTIIAGDTSLHGNCTLNGVTVQAGWLSFSDTAQVTDSHLSAEGIYIARYSNVRFDDCTLSGCLTLDENAAPVGSGNILTGHGEVITLTDTSSDLADFHATATQQDAYIGLSFFQMGAGETFRCRPIDDTLSVYRLQNDLTLMADSALHIEDGATLEQADAYRNVEVSAGGILTAENGTLLFSGVSGNNRAALVISAGGRAELKETRLIGSDTAFERSHEANIQVRNGGTLVLEDAATEQLGSILAESGANLQMLRTQGPLCLRLGAGTQADIHDCDLSSTSIIISGNQGGENTIDLSGNYWGTTDREAIMARISGDTSHVILGEIKLVDPTTDFVYRGNSLCNNAIAAGVTEFTIELAHDINVATVSAESVHLQDAAGNEVSLASVSAEGKFIRIGIPKLTDGVTYRLIVDSAVQNIAGQALADAEGLGYTALLRADYTAPRVSHIDPAGDFAGTLESLRLYMTEAVNLDSLKAGVQLTGPNGNTIAIQCIRDLGGNVYELQTAPQTAHGQYTFSVSNAVCDLAGNRLNQNQNEIFGEAADAFTAAFHIAEVDLTITHAELNGELSMGTPAVITWQGANASGYALHGSWTDGVYLSADPRWDINDRFLGSYTHTGGLAEGETYEGSLTAQLSERLPGDYYILIRSDINGQEQINKESAEWTQNLVAIPVQVSIPRLEIGDLQMGEMSPADSADYLVLHQEAGQNIKLTLHSNVSAANMEIFVGYGRVPTREDYDTAWQKGVSAGEIILPARAGGGDVYLLINNKSSALPLKYTLDAEVLPLTINSVTPGTQGQMSSSTFDIYGTNFTQASQVVFIAEDGTRYTPDDTDFISDGRLRVKFGAKKLPVGKLTVAVTNEYQEQAVLENSVAVTSSSGAHLKIAKIFPDVLGYHMQGTLKLVFENTGTDPMYAPLLTLVGKQNGKEGAILTMDPSIVNQGFWTSAMPEGFANAVSFLAYSASAPGWLMPSGLDDYIHRQVSTSTAGPLQDYLWWRQNSRLVHNGDGYQVSILNDPSVLSKARERASAAVFGGRGSRAWGFVSGNFMSIDYANYLGNTATIYYCGWQQPWDYNYPAFNFELGYLGTDNTATLNWYDSFSYTDMPEEQKRQLAQSLTEGAGNTWGDYVLMLNNNLIYLDELGCVPAGGSTMYDTDSLVTFELMKADGSATPAKTLAVSVDMAQEAQGLSLFIARTYGSSISSRFAEGAFGYGWSFNWDMSLVFREDGTAELHAPGSSLVYQPDYRGGYINTTPNDNAVFAKQKNGSYTRTESDGTRYTFAADGKLGSVRDANGNTITCGYDENGKLCTLTHSGGEQLTLTWDEEGHISSVTNSLGDTTTYRYDRGHLVQVTDYLGDSVSYEYSDTLLHALTRVIGTNGVSEQFTYNERGLLESSALGEAGSPLANYGTITLSYGDNGEVTVTDIYGATTTYYYDNKGQVRRAVDVNGNALTYGYDDKGNLVSFTDQAGNSSAYTYDAAGNMLSSTNALGYRITYTYTEQDKLDVLTDALGHQTDYDYDARGNMTAITYADGSMETWSYDTRGNASSWVNRRGGTVRYSYDSAGRLTARRYEDGTTVSFSYDERGKLLSATDTEGTTRYSYDERERLVRIDTPQGHSLSYGYDEHDNRTSMTDEHGNSTLYAYDGFGHLTRVSDGEGKLITAYTYDQGGRLTTEDRGDGTQVLYTYDKSGQATSITTLTAAGETLSFIRYEYDKTGLRTAMHTQDGSWRYTYDKVGQLTRAVFTPAAGSTLAAQDLRYEYDAAGNRTRSVVNGQETLYTVNALNQTTAAGDTAYQYDADGNMISRTDAEGTTLYTWDAENRLIGVQTAAGDVYAYTYNSAGDRVAETHNGITTQYLYDPAGYGNLVAVYDADSGEQSRTYTHGNGLIGFEDALSGRYWYQGDALGSVTGITDGSGNLIATYSYDPFGTTLSATGSIDNPFLWTGLWGLSTEQTGLLSMRARSYDTTTGKFTSADPIGINGGVNIYAYCGNNGVSLVDPEGTVVPLVMAMAASGAGISTADAVILAASGIGLILSIQNAVSNLASAGSGSNMYGGSPNGNGKGPWDNIKELGQKIKEQAKGLLEKFNEMDAKVIRPKVKYGKNIDAYFGVILWLTSGALAASIPLSAGASDNVNSHDPNDLVGPQGYGTGNFIAPGMEMRFMLRFENEAEATAPTHWMRAFTTFDEAYDLDSFTLNSLYVAGNLIELTEGRDSFNQKVVLTVDGKEVLTEIAVNLDRETRELKAEFTALDPQTGLMLQDPLKGMLYPNDETGRGDAFITYTITAKQELTTGTTIHNAADIYFDFNDVIPTPEIDYTIDADAAHAELLSAEAQTNGTIRLTWTGEDAEGGSGFGGAGIYVSKDGGDLELWQVFTSELTSVDYIGEAGHDYGFAVVGYDNVGNAETVKTAPELFATARGGEQVEDCTTIDLDTVTGGRVTHSAEVTNSVGYGDLADFYAFTAAADGTYAVALDMLAWEGISLSVGTADENAVYHPQKEHLLCMGDANNALEGINLRAGETAYIRVGAMEGAVSTDYYRLKVVGDIPATASLTANNSTEEAAELVATKQDTAVSGWVGAQDACDVYHLQLKEAANLHLSLTGVENAAKLRVMTELADGSTATLFNGTATAAMGGIDRTLALTSGSYFIEVSAANAANGLCNSAYELELEQKKGKTTTHYLLAAK